MKGMHERTTAGHHRTATATTTTTTRLHNPVLLLVCVVFGIWTIGMSSMTIRQNYSMTDLQDSNNNGQAAFYCQTTAATDQSNSNQLLLERSNLDRQVQFLNTTDFGQATEMYSGMWWLEKQQFLATHFTVTFLEGATLNAFYNRPGKSSKNVYMTTDWLDLCVEHLSKYIKHLVKGQPPLLVSGVSELMTNFIQNTRGVDVSSSSSSELAVHSTIAVLPLRASDDVAGNKLIELQLGVTLASLWRIGIGRAVVVGVSDQERQVVKRAFALLKKKTTVVRPMELAYAQHRNATQEETKLVPRVALRGLQMAMKCAENQTDDALVGEWLGKDPNRWKYVYFSEPDLLLQTRPSALPAISHALSQGFLMAAHRLEPIPHQRNFPTYDGKPVVLPDIGIFGAWHQLDPLQGHACCDQGSYYPANPEDSTMQYPVRMRKECSVIWAHCGFGRPADYHNHSTVLDLHKRLLGYPLFTIVGGLGVPLVAANQRVCIPRQGPMTCLKKPQPLRPTAPILNFTNSSS